MGTKSLPGIPWKEVETRYIAGVPQAKLAREYGINPGTLAVRLSTKGLGEAKRELRKHSLAMVGKEVRLGLADELERSTDKLKSMRMPRSIKGLGERASVTGSLVSSAKVVFGWNEDNATSVVNVGVLSSPDTSWSSTKQIVEDNEKAEALADAQSNAE